MSPQDVTLVIAAGGKSKRMGEDKRFLEIGGETMLERVMRKGMEVPFAERMLSVAAEDSSFAENNRASSECLPSPLPSPLTRPSPLWEGGFSKSEFRQFYRIVFDERRDCGPAESLRRALQEASSEWVLFVSADQPFLALDILMEQLIKNLYQAERSQPIQQPPSMRGEGRESGGGSSSKPCMDSISKIQAAVPSTTHRQYLAALYHKSLLPTITNAIASGERRLGAIIPADRTAFVDIPLSAHPASIFFNVNTPADLALARGRAANEARNVPIVTITAPCSNTGKTTFLTRLLPRLAADGIRAGVVKGDAHGYQLDTAGKDSARFAAAGAEAVAVVSPTGFFIEQRTSERRSLLGVAEKFENVDVVFIESRVHGAFPAITLWRGIGDKTPSDIAVAQFTSEVNDQEGSIHTYDINDVDTAVKLVRFLCNV